MTLASLTHSTPSRSPSVSAIILAGGLSRRMGQDKALLPGRDGQPLLHQTTTTALQVASQALIVTPWPERYRVQLSPLPQSRVYLLQEQPSVPAQGPLGGFYQGWGKVSSDTCLLLACDLPYLDSVVLRRWWDSLRLGTVRLPMASLVPRNSGSEKSEKAWQPLCGFYHRSCLPSLQNYLASGGRSFQGWLTNVPVTAYRDVPENMLFNCNTPEDWAAVHL